jgi:uncharacterized protein YndB with AHSA1/START domain
MTGIAEVHQEGDRTLVLVRQLRHPPATVWKALTEPGRLSRWAPFDTGTDLGTPGDAVLTMVDGDTRVDLPGRVLRAEPPVLLEYTWGDDLLRWELTPAGGGTRLTLRHTTGEREWLSRVAAGWHLGLDVAERLLDGEDVTPIRGQEAMAHGWADLDVAYARQLGA